MSKFNKGYTIPEFIVSVGIGALVLLSSISYILRIGTEYYNTVRLNYYLDQIFKALDYHFYENLAVNGRCFSQHPLNPSVQLLKSEGFWSKHINADDLFKEDDVKLSYTEHPENGWTMGYKVSFKLPNKNLTSAFRNNKYFLKETATSLEFYKLLKIDMTTEFSLNMDTDFCEGI